MFYNAKPANTLFARVTLKRQPYSNQPISIQLSAAMHQEFKANSAMFVSELPLESCSMQQIQSVVASFQQQANAQSVQVIIRPPVFKYISDPVA